LYTAKKNTNKAVETTEKLFASQNAAAESLSADDLQNIEGIIKASLQKDAFEKGIDITTMFTDAGIFPSKGEARKMIQAGGVSINRKKGR
jgi:tyrosyl-tRNA synthetase